MNIHLTEFQRVNINDEDILPLYVKQNGTNITSITSITSNKKIIFSLVGIVCFFISYIGLYNMSKPKSLFTSIIDDDTRFHFLQIYE